MATFNRAGFHAALDAARASRDITWKQVAAETGVTDSTFTRLKQGHLLDLPNFAALVDWLGMPADTFISRAASRAEREADPLAVAVAALHADPQLSESAAGTLSTVLTTLYAALADRNKETMR